MAVTMTALTSGGDATDAASYATASVTPTTGSLQLLAVVNAKGTPTTPTVTGCGLTWVEEKTVAFNTASSPAKRTTVFRARGTASAGVITIDFGGTSQNGCAWSLVEFAGINTSGTNGSGAIVQSVVGTADSASSLSITLAAFGSVGNATYGAFGSTSANVLSAGSGFTQIIEVSFTPPSVQLLTEWRNDNDTTVDATSTGTPAWGGVAIEIKAATGTVDLVGSTAGTSTVSGGLTQTGVILLAGTSAGRATTSLEVATSGFSWIWQPSILDGTGRVTAGCYDGVSRWYSGSDTAGVHRTTDDDKGWEAFQAGLHVDPGGGVTKQYQHCAGIAATADTVVQINGHPPNGGSLQTRLAADTAWRVNTRYFGDASNRSAGGEFPRPTGRRVVIDGTRVWVSCQDSSTSNKYGIARSTDYGVTWSSWSFSDDRHYTGLFYSATYANVIYASATSDSGAGAPGVFVTTAANGTAVWTRLDNVGSGHPTFTSCRDVICIHEGSNDVLFVVADSTDLNGGIWKCVVGDPTAGGWSSGSVVWTNITPPGNGQAAADWNALCGKRSGSATYIMAACFNAAIQAGGTYTLGNGESESGGGTDNCMATHMRSLDGGSTWSAVSGQANVPQPTIIYGTANEIWVQCTAKHPSLNKSRVGGGSHSTSMLVLHPTTDAVLSYGKGGIWRCNNPWAATPIWKPFVQGLGGIGVDVVAVDPTNNLHTVNTDADRHGYNFFNGGDGQPKCYWDTVPHSSTEAWCWPPVTLNNNKGQTLIGNTNIVSINSDPWNVNSDYVTRDIGSNVDDLCRFGYSGQIITLVLTGNNIKRWTTDALTGGTTAQNGGVGSTGTGGQAFCAIDEDKNVYLYTTSGWWRSTNAGSSWSKVSTHTASSPSQSEAKCAQDRLHPTTLYYTLAGTNGLWKVTNAATTFNTSQVTGGLLTANSRCGLVAVDPTTGDVAVYISPESAGGADILYAPYGSTNFQSIKSSKFADLCDLPMCMQFVGNRILFAQDGAGIIQGVRGTTVTSTTEPVAGTTGGSADVSGELTVSWALAGATGATSVATLNPQPIVSMSGTSVGLTTASLSVETPPALLYTFTPPTQNSVSPVLPDSKGLPWRLMRHYPMRARGVSVLKTDGEYRTVIGPTIAECAAATEVYIGGHMYVVSADVAIALETAGYTTEVILSPEIAALVAPTQQTRPWLSMFCQADSTSGTTGTIAYNTTNGAAQLATWYDHVHCEQSAYFRLGEASGSSSLATKLVAAGVNKVSNYRNGSYVSQSNTTAPLLFGEAANIEQYAPLAIGTFWPGHKSATSGSDGTSQMLSATNADFDAGSVGGWGNFSNVGSKVVSTDTAYNGTSSLKVTSSTGAGGNMVVQLGAATAMAVVPGFTYTFSSNVRAATTPRSFTVLLRWFQDTAGTLSAVRTQDESSAQTDSTSAWTANSITAVAPSDALYVGIQVKWTSGNAAIESHYIDGNILSTPTRESVLTAGINASVTSVTVSSAAFYKPTGATDDWPFFASRGTGAGVGTVYSTDTHNVVSWVRVDDEIMRVTGVSGPTAGVVTLTVGRGYWGTTAATHAINAKVFSPVYIGSTTADTSDANLAGAPNVDSAVKALRYGIKIWTSTGYNWIADRIIATFNGTGSSFQGYNTVWSDVSGPFRYNNADATGNPVEPWYDPGSTIATTDNWAVAQETKLAGIKARVLAGGYTGIKYLCNNYVYVGTGGVPNAVDLKKKELMGTGSWDGYVMENWMHEISKFSLLMGQFFDVMINNWKVIVWFKTSTLTAEDGTQGPEFVDSNQYFRFCYGCVLLAWRSTATNLQIGGGVQLERPKEFYFYNLGAPTGNPTGLSDFVPGSTAGFSQPTSGVYVREFSKGTVIVNATALDAQVTTAELYDVTYGVTGSPGTTWTVPSYDAIFLAKG